MSLLTRILVCAALVCLSHSGQLPAQTITPSENFPFTLNIVRDIAENLLKNPDFEELNQGNSAPVGWDFGNFANSPDVTSGTSKHAHKGTQSVLVHSQGNFPGYWTQTIKVQEGVRYYASVYIQADMNEGSMGLRLATEQYHDDGPGISWATNNSHTDVRSYAECGQGVGLEDFIDPANLRVVRRREWNLFQLEFVVPVGKKVDRYDFWAGLYGIGTATVDDAYFGKATYELHGTVSGAGIKRVRILDASGKAFLDQPVKENEAECSFKVTIESRLSNLQMEVVDINGKLWRKSL